MNKRLYAVLILLTAIMCISFSSTVFAETEAVDVAPTEAVIATEAPTNSPVSATDAPIGTEAPTTPEPTDTADTTAAVDTVPDTQAANTSATVAASTAATEATTEATVIATNPPEPTEPDEDSTYSDYVSPAPVYTPADQDFEENDWQEIELDLGANPVDGKGDFAFIQENNSKGNDSIMHFLILGVVLLFLSIAGFTFVILYKPKTASKAAGRTASAPKSADIAKRSKPTDTAKRRRPDDYDDGYY